MKSPSETKILVVDDEEDLRDAIVFDFKRKGFQVLEAANGQEAFEKVKSEKIDIIITDVKMPIADGVQLLKWVKALSSDLPVVMFITGFSDLSMQDAFNEGADAVFSKPFDRKALFLAVESALKTKEELWSKHASSSSPLTSSPDPIATHPLNVSLPCKLSLGRGGAFLTAADVGANQELRENSQIQFQCQLELQNEFQAKNGLSSSSAAPPSTPLLTVQGTGIIRWVRASEQDGLPAGVGIEFKSLDESCRSKVIEHLVAARPKAFIPKK